MVQDRATSVVWGMPGYVTRANLGHEVLPLAAISQAIVRSVLRSRGQAGPAERPRAGLESSNG